LLGQRKMYWAEIEGYKNWLFWGHPVGQGAQNRTDLSRVTKRVTQKI